MGLFSYFNDLRGNVVSEPVADLRLPTDAEISAMVNGVPVLSHTPEDFPHWRPSIYQGHSSVEFSERAQAIYNSWLDFNPALGNVSGAYRSAESFSGTRSTHVGMFWFNANDSPSFFSLLKPSETMDVAQEAANSFGLQSNVVNGAIPTVDSHFIDVHHEIGHMDAAVKGLDLSDHAEELYADKFGLQKYIDAGGDMAVVRDYINSRAIAGFLKQPWKYWVAPELAAHFLENGAVFDERAAFHTNAELRLRVTDITDGGNKLASYTSEQIHDALDLFDSGRTADIEDLNLRAAIESLDDIRNHSGSNYSQDKSMVFSAVDAIANNPNIDPRTRRNAQMVMDGAITFTPTLVPDRIRRNRANLNIDAPKNVSIADEITQGGARISSRLARLGQDVPVVGALVTAGVGGLMVYDLDFRKEQAKALLDNGDITASEHKILNTIFDNALAIYSGDLAFSAVPEPISGIAVSVGAELSVQSQWADIRNQLGSKLTDDQLSAVSPALFVGKSFGSEMRDTLEEHLTRGSVGNDKFFWQKRLEIPAVQNSAGQAEDFSTLVSLAENVREVEHQFILEQRQWDEFTGTDHTYMQDFNQRRKSALGEVEQAYASEIGRLMQDPVTAEALLDHLPNSDEFMFRVAYSSADSLLIENKPPLIEDIAQSQQRIRELEIDAGRHWSRYDHKQGYWTHGSAADDAIYKEKRAELTQENSRLEALRDELEDNPEIAKQYTMQVMGGVNTDIPAEPTEAPQAGQDSSWNAEQAEGYYIAAAKSDKINAGFGVLASDNVPQAESSPDSLPAATEKLTL